MNFKFNWHIIEYEDFSYNLPKYTLNFECYYLNTGNFYDVNKHHHDTDNIQILVIESLEHENSFLGLINKIKFNEKVLEYIKSQSCLEGSFIIEAYNTVFSSSTIDLDLNILEKYKFIKILE